MLKVNKGNIEINGIEPTIRAEFSMLVRTLYKEEVLSMEEIEEAVETGLMSDKELNKIFREKMDELLKEIKSEMED